MQTGTYKTTDPNVRIRVVPDTDYPLDDRHFPYAPGVLEELQKCYEEGNYYGVIVEKRNHQSTEQIAQDVLDQVCVSRVEEIVHIGQVRDIVERAIETDREQRGNEWEDHDSIWSCAGYENVAEEVAKEYFGITVTGRE